LQAAIQRAGPASMAIRSGMPVAGVVTATRQNRLSYFIAVESSRTGQGYGMAGSRMQRGNLPAGYRSPADFIAITVT